jgi:hypothetical protein
MLRPMRLFGLVLLLVPLLGGCAEVWVRPGTTEAEADAMNAACRNEADLAVPPHYVWQMVEPPRIERDRRCWVRDGREHCRDYERYRPARYGHVDVAAGQRDAWRRSCMQQQGFTFQGYRPLRLQ